MDYAKVTQIGESLLMTLDSCGALEHIVQALNSKDDIVKWAGDISSAPTMHKTVHGTTPANDKARRIINVL